MTPTVDFLDVLLIGLALGWLAATITVVIAHVLNRRQRKATATSFVNWYDPRRAQTPTRVLPKKLNDEDRTAREFLNELQRERRLAQ